MHQKDPRLAELKSWLTTGLRWRVKRIAPASADASFRRYFRVWRDAATFVVMDAPPEKEDSAPYLKVSKLLAATGIHVPQVHEADLRRGYVVLEDLGDTQYLTRLRAGGHADSLYGDALACLARLQVEGLEAARQLPPYDRAPLSRELNLMPEWFLERHLKLTLTPEERALLTVTFEFLMSEVLEQPMVFVHRDFHSRNLMVTATNNPGVLDFQDALRGPIGYDLVSLLKDCYIAWPRSRVEAWLRDHRRLVRARGLDTGADDQEFLRWFDLAGVQRHLKVLGIFARLWHRDGKVGYLGDLPLTLDYVRDTCARYTELTEFVRWLEVRIVPRLAPANVREVSRSQRGRPVRVIKKRKTARRAK
ncbi:MAG TPA: phosphotransferase [Steroidobacteraceae bacterium]|nr:phosphotransferase [Steroidobacteraceae bacterium]HRX87918.1 phosphotransferase [Steroidobacteraceae bacterium]